MVFLKNPTRLFLTIVGLGLGMLTACSDDNDQDYPQLKIDVESIDIKIGETAQINILKGSGKYETEAGDPTIIEAVLDKKAVSVTGLKAGSSTVSIKDLATGTSASVPVVVTPAAIPAAYTDPAHWFSTGLPADIATSERKESETDEELSTSFYQLILGETPVLFNASTLNDLSWLYEAVPTDTDADTQVDFFNKALQSYVDDDEFWYWRATFWHTGDDSPENLDTFENLESHLENADFSTENFRVGFKTDSESVEISIVENAATLKIRPLTFRDDWIWYTKNWLGASYDTIYSEMFFSIKSSGFIPPFFQLTIFNGLDEQNTSFNLTFRAAPNSPIDRVEGAYLLASDEVKNYWISLLEDSEAETKMGEFEQTFVFPLDNGTPQRLATLAETVTWAKTHELSEVSYVMPIFRISDSRVIVPQASSGAGLIVTMSELAAETTSQPALLKAYLK